MNNRERSLLQIDMQWMETRERTDMCPVVAWDGVKVAVSNYGFLLEDPEWCLAVMWAHGMKGKTEVVGSIAGIGATGNSVQVTVDSDKTWHSVANVLYCLTSDWGCPIEVEYTTFKETV
jgi:hypothetical protein